MGTTAHHRCAQERPPLLTLYSHPGGSLSCYLDLPSPCLRRVSHSHRPELPKATSVAQRTYALLWALGYPLGGDKTLSHEVIVFSLHSPPLFSTLEFPVCLEHIRVPAGLLIQKLLMSPCIRTVTCQSRLSTTNTHGSPGVKTGGSRGRVTWRESGPK